MIVILSSIRTVCARIKTVIANKPAVSVYYINSSLGKVHTISGNTTTQNVGFLKTCRSLNHTQVAINISLKRYLFAKLTVCNLLIKFAMYGNKKHLHSTTIKQRASNGT